MSSVKLRQTRLNRKSVKCKIKADLPQFGKCQIKVSSVKLRQVCPNSESVKDWKKVSSTIYFFSGGLKFFDIFDTFLCKRFDTQCVKCYTLLTVLKSVKYPVFSR